MDNSQGGQQPGREYPRAEGHPAEPGRVIAGGRGHKPRWGWPSGGISTAGAGLELARGHRPALPPEAGALQRPGPALGPITLRGAGSRASPKRDGRPGLRTHRNSWSRPWLRLVKSTKLSMAAAVRRQQPREVRGGRGRSAPLRPGPAPPRPRNPPLRDAFPAGPPRDAPLPWRPATAGRVSPIKAPPRARRPP